MITSHSYVYHSLYLCSTHCVYVCACVVRDTYVSYTIIDKCCQQLGSNTDILKTQGIDLSCIRTCVVVSEERSRTSLLHSFTALFSLLGLTSHALSTSFGCRVNLIICLQVLMLALQSVRLEIASSFTFNYYYAGVAECMYAFSK